MKKILLLCILVAGIAAGCATTNVEPQRAGALYRFKVVDTDSTVTYSKIDVVVK